LRRRTHQSEALWRIQCSGFRVKPGIDLTLEVEGKEIMMKQGVPKTALSVGILAIMRGFAVSVMILAISAVTPKASLAQRASETNRSATQALNTLYQNNPGARSFGNKAVGILVFPSIVKGGFIVAGQFGDGVLRKGGKPVAYYRSLAASYGF